MKKVSDQLTTSDLEDKQAWGLRWMGRQAYRFLLNLPLGFGWLAEKTFSFMYWATQSVQRLVLGLVITSIIRILTCFVVRSVILYMCLMKSSTAGIATTFPLDVAAALLNDVYVMLTGGLYDYVMIKLYPLLFPRGWGFRQLIADNSWFKFRQFGDFLNRNVPFVSTFSAAYSTLTTVLPALTNVLSGTFFTATVGLGINLLFGGIPVGTIIFLISTVMSGGIASFAF